MRSNINFLVWRCTPIEQSCATLSLESRLGQQFYCLDALLCKSHLLMNCQIICRPDLTITEECFELLSLVAIASEDGAYKFCEPGVMDMLFSQISNFPDGTKSSGQSLVCLIIPSPSSFILPRNVSSDT